MQVKQALETTPLECLYDAQRYVERRLVQKWLSRFTATPDFITRQRPVVNIGHVVDDVIADHRRRTVHAVQRVSRTRDIVFTLLWGQPSIMPYGYTFLSVLGV